MRTKFFVIPALDPAAAEEDLNRFLAQHRILTLDRQLVQLQGGAFWSICVTYQISSEPGRVQKGKVDYKELLSPEDFSVYAELRSLRKEIAEAEGVPPYHVLNNAHLAEMVQKRMRTLEELAAISGVGPARIEAYGARFLERLKELQSSQQGRASDETNADSD